jgi:putative N6-adenine-specific DNA methylase
MHTIYTALALCAVGAERALSNELRKGTFPVLESGFGRVRFQADIRGLYRALMGLRTADRLLLEAARFPAADFDALFEGIRAIPWESYIPRGMGLTVVKVRVRSSRLQALTSIQGVAHKAAAERLCGALGINRLPEQGPQAELRIYIEKDEASALLDLSGEALFKRGYRSEGGTAPIRETTAAAILLLSGWRRKFPLWDPFCGSGTIPIEAAMYAWNMAPGLGRNFALSRLILGDRELEAEVRKELLQKVDFSKTIRIYGSDADARAVALARSNAQRAFALARGENPVRGIQPALRDPALPDFRTLPMGSSGFGTPDSGVPAEAGYVITNPPYGRRLGEVESAERTYAEMAVLARNFPGWKLGLVTDHPGFESHFGEKADSCREITNGAIRLYFYEYTALGE